MPIPAYPSQTIKTLRRVADEADARKQGVTPRADLPGLLKQYIAFVGDTALPGRDGSTPGKLALPVYRINSDEELEAVETSGGDPVEFDVFNLSESPSPTNDYIVVVQERYTGRLLYASNDASPGFPPGVSCNESNCAEGAVVGSAVCCKTHPTFTVRIPPFGDITFTYESGETWTAPDITKVCDGGEDTYSFERTIESDAPSGTFTSTITITRTSADPAVCSEWCIVYQTCCLPDCQCEQPHKLKHYGGLKCSLPNEGGELARWICLKPGAIGGCLNDGGETLPEVFVVNFPDELAADPYVVALGGLGPHFLPREPSNIGNTVCGEELQNMAAPYGGCLWVKWANPATRDGAFVAFMRTLLGAERWCVVVGAGGAIVCAPGTYGWYEEVADFDPLADGELTNVFEAGAMTAPPYFGTLAFGSPEDNADTTISIRPQNLPSDDGLCDSPCADVYGGASGGGGGCDGGCTLEWSDAQARWNTLENTCTGAGSCENEPADCCACGHPGRDGAFDGEVVLVDCTCCDCATTTVGGVCAG